VTSLGELDPVAYSSAEATAQAD